MTRDNSDDFTEPATLDGHTFKNIRVGTCSKCGEWHWHGYLCQQVKRSLAEQIAWRIRELGISGTRDKLSNLKKEDLERILNSLFGDRR